MEVASSGVVSGGPNDTMDNEQASKLVDRIIYLASLASRREDIDPMMDTLREVTATWHRPELLGSESQTALKGLEGQLKEYLVHNDPLRKFTPESLDERLHTQTTTQLWFLKTHREQAALVISGSLAVTILTVALLPNSIVFSDRLMIAMQPFYASLCGGAVWFYLSALRNFRPELKHAFMLMCCAVICMGFDFSTYSFISLFKKGDLEIFKYGGLLWAVMLSFIFMYLGVRIYARLIGIKSAFTSLRNVAILAGVLGAAAVLAPHASKPTNEFFFDLSFASAVIYAGVALCGGLVAASIVKNVTAAFRRSMLWICIYQLACIPGSIIGAGTIFYLGKINGQALNFELAALGIGPLLLLFYTGYSFKKETNK